MGVSFSLEEERSTTTCWSEGVGMLPSWKREQMARCTRQHYPAKAGKQDPSLMGGVDMVFSSVEGVGMAISGGKARP